MAAMWIVPGCGFRHALCGPRSRVGRLDGRRRWAPWLMAYDEDLAERIRECMAAETGVSERLMFGGLAFLLRGNMCLAVSRQGGILVRVDPAAADELVAAAKAEVAVMGGRPMRGWLRVAPEDLRTKRRLAPWVRRGVDYARSLPAK
ncbi:TfoX/Sxy family protein [Streptomyces sp. NPDC001251]